VEPTVMMLSRPHYLRARVAALLDEFPDGGPELCGAIVDLIIETTNEIVADVYRERTDF
jgi:hypothetical protein